MLLSFSGPLAYAAIAVAWSTFVVPHTKDADDTLALMAAIPGYTSDASIVFEADTTYNIWSPITFPPFTNVEVVISGNLTYPTSIKTVQGHVATAIYSGSRSLEEITSRSAVILILTGVGLMDMASSGGMSCNRPTDLLVGSLKTLQMESSEI